MLAKIGWIAADQGRCCGFQSVDQGKVRSRDAGLAWMSSRCRALVPRVARRGQTSGQAALWWLDRRTASSEARRTDLSVSRRTPTLLLRDLRLRTRAHMPSRLASVLSRLRSRAGAVQAVLNGSPMSAVQGTTVHERLLHHTSDIARWQHLRSAGCRPRHRRSMFGQRGFPVAGPAACSSLPNYLWDPTRSVDSFRRDLKTFLFSFY